MSDGDDRTSGLPISFLCECKMARWCIHKSMLKIEYEWTVSDACQSWETIETMKRSKPLSVSFLPGIEFYITLKRDHLFPVKNEFFISLNRKATEDDFECYVWFGDNKLINPQNEHKIEINKQYTLPNEHSSAPVQCKIVYKKCPICTAQRASANKIKQLRNVLSERTANVAKLTVERDNLIVERDSIVAECKKFATILTRTEANRDEWKAIAREQKVKLVDMTEKSQSTTNQLTLSVEQLKLELDNRSLVNNFELLWKLQQENKLTDFSLMVDGKSIQVHKNVLAVKSKFFAQQFEEHPAKFDYSINKRTFEAVEQMVEFVYLGQAANFDEHLNELYTLSVRFHIDALKDKCVNSLESKLTMQAAPEIFILATKYKDEKLSQIVVEYVQGKGAEKTLFVSDEFLSLLETDVKLYTEVLKALRC
ncbi:BTB domain-containing protein [Aphelenchoides besseyi]|nr:BTB domain-containing protein [Aphelenchoides besseyi]